MAKRLTTEEFLATLSFKRSDKGLIYDYHKVDYINNYTEICIICTKSGHGEFWQRPNNHQTGAGCPKCAREEVGLKNKKTNEEFKADVRKIWGDQFDLSETIYNGSKKKVTVICRKHGKFKTQSSFLLMGRQVCKGCKADSRSFTEEEFIKKATKVHKGKYLYPNPGYTRSHQEVEIFCKKKGHGFFKQNAGGHLGGYGCPICAKESIGDRNRHTLEDFIKKAKKTHPKSNLDYSKVDYINSNTKVTIHCKKKGHGDFRMTPGAHIYGQGCPKCGIETRVKKATKTQSDFIKDCKAVWGERYILSSINYVNADHKVDIICRRHGKFSVKAYAFLQKHGCRECQYEKISKMAGESPTGWSYSNWEKSAEASDNFISFKVYILRLVDIDGTVFFKIGRTYRELKDRFYNGSIPYDFEVLEIIIGENAREICELEQNLKNLCKEFSYTPKKDFGGMYECYSCIDPIENILKELCD